MVESLGFAICNIMSSANSDSFISFQFGSYFIHSLVIYICPLNFFLFLKILFIYFLERGREGEREGKKHQCVVVSQVPPTGDLACNPGMCPRRGIVPVTLWFTGWHSIHSATPARAISVLLRTVSFLSFWIGEHVGVWGVWYT